MKKQQRGMTLIELMISLVLSLGLIAGISSLFVQMQKSNKIQRGLSAMTDESSYVQEVLQKEIRRTGGLRSRSDTNGQEDRIFLGNPTNTFHQNVLGSGLAFNDGEYIKGAANNRFILRYQLLDANDLGATDPSNSNSPCTMMTALDAAAIPQQDPAVQNHVVSVYIYLNGTTLSCTAQRAVQDRLVSGAGNEWCSKNCATERTSFAGSVTADYVPPATPATLINNVTSLTMRYGIDFDGDKSANYYVTAADVPAALWTQVVSVRLSVVVRSEEDHLTDTKVAYKIDGVLQSAPTDNRLYKAITTTIALRNQL